MYSDTNLPAPGTFVESISTGRVYTVVGGLFFNNRTKHLVIPVISDDMPGKDVDCIRPSKVRLYNPTRTYEVVGNIASAELIVDALRDRGVTGSILISETPAA